MLVAVGRLLFVDLAKCTSILQIELDMILILFRAHHACMRFQLKQFSRFIHVEHLELWFLSWERL